MESVYEKADGMLLTIPGEIEESDIKQYMSSKALISVKYEKDIFEAILSRASHLKVVETRYVSGELKNDVKEELITPENAVIYRKQLYGFMHLEIGANYRQRRFVKLSDLEKRYLYDSHTEYFDEPGDHDSWSIETYLEICYTE